MGQERLEDVEGDVEVPDRDKLGLLVGLRDYAWAVIDGGDTATSQSGDVGPPLLCRPGSTDEFFESGEVRVAVGDRSRRGPVGYDDLVGGGCDVTESAFRFFEVVDGRESVVEVEGESVGQNIVGDPTCLLYTSPSPRD